MSALGRPLHPSLMAYCARFLRAGWTVEEVAWLFDLDEGRVGAAFRRQAL